MLAGALCRAGLPYFFEDHKTDSCIVLMSASSMVGGHVESVVEGNETTGSASASVGGAKETVEVNVTKEIASVLASVTDNNAAQDSSAETSSRHAEDLNAVPERTPSAAKEEHSSKSETAEPPKSAQSWGWTGWGNVLAVVQDAASEVPQFREHKKRKSSFQACYCMNFSALPYDAVRAVFSTFTFPVMLCSVYRLQLLPREWLMR